MNKVITKKKVKVNEDKSDLELRRLNAKFQHEDISETELAHYGVMGMRWGVRNANASESEGFKNTLDAVQKNFGKINKMAQPDINAGVAKINEKYKKDDIKKLTKDGWDSYFKEVSKVVTTAYTKATDSLLGSQIPKNIDYVWTYDVSKDAYPAFFAAERYD